MRCDRCGNRERSSAEMLHLTVHPIPAAGPDEDGNGTQEVFLCPRCAMFCLGVLGATRHIITVMDPLHEKWSTDVVGIGKDEMMQIALRTFVESEKMPKEASDG